MLTIMIFAILLAALKDGPFLWLMTAHTTPKESVLSCLLVKAVLGCEELILASTALELLTAGLSPSERVLGGWRTDNHGRGQLLTETAQTLRIIINSCRLRCLFTSCVIVIA